MMIKLPNFIIIGAAKSGTISLYHYLNEHDQIYMSPVLEPKFFEFAEGEKPVFNGLGDQRAYSHVITDLESYSRLFEGSVNEIAIGESSPSYMYIKGVAERIKQTLPDVKILAMIRHPVERAYSNFLHLYSAGREPFASFERALEAEEERINNHWEYFWHYQNQGFYYQHLKRYFNVFDREQIKVCLYDDYRSQPIDTVRDIFRFLNVDDTFLPNVTRKYNVTSFVKSSSIFNLMMQPNPIKSIAKHLIPSDLRSKILAATKKKISTHEKPELPLKIKENLLAEYQEDILSLQDLIEKDLHHWLDISKIH